MQSKKRKTSLGDRVDLDNVLSTHFSFHFVSFLFLSVVSYIQLKTLMQLDFLFFWFIIFKSKISRNCFFFCNFCFALFGLLFYFFCVCVCVCCSLFFFGRLLNTAQIPLCVYVTLFIWNTRFGVCVRVPYTQWKWTAPNNKINKIKWKKEIKKTKQKKTHHDDNDSRRGEQARVQQKRPKTQSWITHRRNVYTFICLKHNETTTTTNSTQCVHPLQVGT